LGGLAERICSVLNISALVAMRQHTRSTPRHTRSLPTHTRSIPRAALGDHSSDNSASPRAVSLRRACEIRRSTALVRRPEIGDRRALVATHCRCTRARMLHPR
jgi:hypothetical protein